MAGAIRGTLCHATALALAVDRDGPAAGILIEGPSGSGKSDLALRLIESCRWRRTRLVADDSVILSGHDGRLLAECPETIAGLIEIRGVGITPMARAERAWLAAIIRLGPPPGRLPEPASEIVPGTGGLALPVLTIDPQQLSAPVKVVYGVRSLLAGHSV